MKLDPQARYTKSHEWVRWDGNLIVCGITDHAQESLSDIVYVELPNVGDTFAADDIFGVVESVKAASDLYLPLAGEIVAVNEALEDAPEQVNRDPFGEGWLIRLKPAAQADFDSLLSGEQYEAAVAAEEA